MVAIPLFLREEAADPDQPAPDTPEHAPQTGVNWTSAYILLPIIVIILVVGSIAWYKVRQRLRDANRPPVDEEAQAQRAEDIADGYLAWLEELGQRASRIGIWHPRDSEPAHLASVTGEASNSPRRGESTQADSVVEEHEFTEWPNPYIPDGEREMNIKPKAKADRQASKNHVKVNPATGLPYGYTVRNVRKPVEGSPFGHTWVPQFVDPEGVVVVDEKEIRRLKAMAAELNEPSSSYSSPYSPEPVMTSGVQDSDGYGYGRRTPSDEWPLAPRQTIPDAKNPFGSGAYGSKPHASSPLADVDEDSDSPYSNSHSRPYGGSLGPASSSRRWQELEQRTYGNIEMPEPNYGNPSLARSNTSTAQPSNIGTSSIGTQSRSRGQTTSSRGRSDSRSEASSSRVEPKYKLNEHGLMRPNPARSQSRGGTSTQPFERTITRQHTFPPESPSSSSEGYPTSGTRYTTRPSGHSRTPATASASKTDITDFGNQTGTTASPAAPQSLRARSKAPTPTPPKPRTPARAPKYGLFPPVAYANESLEQKEARLQRQEILKNLYKEVHVPAAGDKGKKKDDEDKDDKGKGKQFLWK